MDAKDFMRMLMEEDVSDYSEWRSQCLKARAFLSSYDKQMGNMAVEKIASLLPENPNVSVDVGMNQCWCARSLVLKGYEGRIHISGVTLSSYNELDSYKEWIDDEVLLELEKLTKFG